MGNLPLYRDLEPLFAGIINKSYPKDLYDRQFSLYVNNIVARIELQEAAYAKEENIPARLFEILAKQKEKLLSWKQGKGGRHSA